MNLRTAFSALALILGTALVGWALFVPLVTFPMVGSVRFYESGLGGPWLTGIIVALLASGAIIYRLPCACGHIASLCGGAGLGLVGGAVWAIYRSGIDHLMELADTLGKDIQLLLQKMEYGAGAYLLAFGALLWLIGALLAPRAQKC